MAQFKYLGLAATNQNLIQDEIKRRLNSDYTCYHSVQNLLLSRLLSKNIKSVICKTIILPVVLYGYDTWSLIISEKYGLSVLQRIFRPRRDEVRGGCRGLHNEKLHNLYSSPNIIRMVN
jgi:hypothetical protein